MPTQQDTQNSSSTGETQGQEQQGQQQQVTPETGANGQQQQEPTPITDETRLPDTHPLVKAYRAQLEENRKNSGTKTELAEANARAAKVTQLEADLAARPTQEALDTLQTRYDRLEAFAQAVGLGKALDSRTFTRDLFESDKDIKTLVQDWNKANPSATSQALSGKAGGAQGQGKVDPNELIRAAFAGGSGSN
ncbi:scaffolding protein [Microbacterium phage Neferthena]|uniref:Scaffolding protein n=1 Tax=Microbacterium phage Neferthena TaxID=2301539 RepID=A0A385D4Q0_9CAUD|nr:scaffolding protein [Microbacterium phage Neferthena]AXQ52871.1 scaffolding protein [Microbacterium phage Neferthena]